MHKQRGISLIELMIAMLIGLMITGAVTQAFLGSLMTSRMQGSMSRLQENGRFALQYLAQESRPAGVGLGVRMPEDQICVVANSPNTVRLNQPVWGLRSTGAAGHYGLSGTDELHLFATDNCGSFVSQKEADKPGGANANTNVTAYCPSMRQDALVLIADLEKAVLLRLTNNVTEGNDAGKKIYQLTHAASGNNQDAVCGGFKFSNLKFNTSARVLGFDHRIYYVANTGRVGANGQPIRALFVRDSVAGTAEEVVDGVESMRIRYGVAVAGRDAVEQYMTAAQVEAANRWGDVRTVGFELLLVADGQTAGADQQQLEFDGAAVVADGRLRQVYRTVVALRNRVE